MYMYDHVWVEGRRKLYCREWLQGMGGCQARKGLKAGLLINKTSPLIMILLSC